MPEGISVTVEELVGLRGVSRRLELGARRTALAAEAGGFHSIYKGRGLEFDEVRPYQPGDDSRTIDWRVTARRGRPHTKLFREERERPVFVLVDLHPGMYFGTRNCFKSVAACRLAAVIAWAAERAGDRIGGVVAGAAGHAELQPRARREGVLRMFRELENLQPMAPGELEYGRLDESLARLTRVTKKGSLVFIISDFQELGDEAERHLTALSRHNDVIAAMVFDPLEANPPSKGMLEMGTPEIRNVVDLGRSRTSKSWKERFSTHRSSVMDVCRQHQVSFMDVSTEDDLVRVLAAGLAGHGVRR